MGWRIKRVAIERATPDLINQIKDMTPAPGDRPFKQSLYDDHQRKLEAGKFMLPTWTRAFCREDGVTYRVNGKHTSRLFAALGEALPEMYAVVQDVEADTLVDVADVYGQHDSIKSGRTAREIGENIAGAIPQLNGVPKKILHAFAGGLDLYVSESGYGTKATTQEKYGRLHDHWPELVWAAKILSGAYAGGECEAERLSGDHMQKVGVAAAMIATYGANPEKAGEFWAAVRDETGRSAKHPDRLYGRYLALLVGSKEEDEKKKGRAEKYRYPRSREVYARGVTAWNAWMNDRITQLSYSPLRPIPQAVKVCKRKK